VGGEALLDRFETTSQVANGSGRPVGGTYGVEDRSPDPLSGEPVEGNATGLVVATSGFHEAERTSGGELFTIYVSREVDRDLEHHVSYQRQMLLDQLV